MSRPLRTIQKNLKGQITSKRIEIFLKGIFALFALMRPTLDFTFSGANFNILGSTSNPDILNTDIFGTTGLTAYSRMSSNNARWAIADELRVPTNADKKIYGHVSIPVGLEESRSAWEEEATVVVEVRRADGSTKDYGAKTEGHSNDEPGISIYGEEPRSGLFEVVLDDTLEKGDTVRIKEVSLTSGELSQGYENIILTDTLEVFPVLPPTPAEFSSTVIAEDSSSVQGYTQNKEVTVTATHNGEAFDTEDVLIDTEGNFSIDLSTLALEENDEIQVFLRDKEGSAALANVVNPPKTNNEQGNINPATALSFHDATFDAATTLIVANVGSVTPVDPLDPDKEVSPENPSVLPEEQGRISIDFISQFNFGQVSIASDTKLYDALPQRLLNEDGTISEEERSNYVQISDRREINDGWELKAELAAEGFLNSGGEQLKGARILLENTEMVTTSSNTSVEPFYRNTSVLEPGNLRSLAVSRNNEGRGTWIQRYGNSETSGSSVKLEVPVGANPKAAHYQATIEWQLSFTPGNE